MLLDANENAYGPGLALNNEGALQASQTGDATGVSTPEIDFLGLNRYPDPLVSPIHDSYGHCEKWETHVLTVNCSIQSPD